MTLIVLQISKCISVFMDSILNFYQYKILNPAKFYTEEFSKGLQIATQRINVISAEAEFRGKWKRREAMENRRK